MKLGVKENIDSDTLNFYEYYYDVIRTPDFNDKTRFITSDHGLKFLGSKHNKTCRFCGRTEKEVSFRKVAHAFPESIGNKALATYYECDDCNNFFGRTIENDYSKFFALYHSIMQISGKDGRKKCCFKVSCDKRQDNCADNCIRIEFNGTQPTIMQCREVSEEYIAISDKSIKISMPADKCCPIAVFKALVKMALTVMPAEDINLFSDAVKWLLEKEHRNFYSSRPLLIRYQMIPGFNVVKFPVYMLYRRKMLDLQKPYMLFNITYGCFSLLIEVQRNNEPRDQADNRNIEQIPFPPIPFYVSENGVWDMSGSELAKGFKHSIILNFDRMQEISPDKITIGKNKTPVLKRE